MELKRTTTKPGRNKAAGQSGAYAPLRRTHKPHSPPFAGLADPRAYRNRLTAGFLLSPPKYYYMSSRRLWPIVLLTYARQVRLSGYHARCASARVARRPATDLGHCISNKAAFLPAGILVDCKIFRKKSSRLGLKSPGIWTPKSYVVNTLHPPP